MPNLMIGEADAEAIADFLLKTQGVSLKLKVEPGQVEKGKAIANEKGCWTCHSMAGVEGLKASAIPVEMDPRVMAQGMLLALSGQQGRTVCGERAAPSPIPLLKQITTRPGR